MGEPKKHSRQKLDCCLTKCGVRDDYYVLTSLPREAYREYTVSNTGFSFQLQNRFRLSSKLWLHITPFIEPAYDASQNTGGYYVGVIWGKK